MRYSDRDGAEEGEAGGAGVILGLGRERSGGGWRGGGGEM